MFIRSSKAFEFVHPDYPETIFAVPVEYIGEVPDWVAASPLFRLAQKDGSITTVGYEKSISPGKAVSAEELALRQRARELNIEDAETMHLIDLAVMVREYDPDGEAAASGIQPPPDNPQLVAAIQALQAMNLDALQEYAAANSISLGNATSENGIRKKIIEHLS